MILYTYIVSLKYSVLFSMIKVQGKYILSFRIKVQASRSLQVYKFPLLPWSISMDSKSALKLPAPNP